MSHSMECNENVIKNIANEISRECQAHNLAVDPEFVVYMVDLLLLNPKYGLLFAKQINRDNLEYFVNECVSMLLRGETSIKTMKMQFVIQTNYDKLHKLTEKHLLSIEEHLRPLLDEILDAEPDSDEELNKLFRKISIYFILASGLGNPGIIVTLKEGMAAMQSVFSLEDLKAFIALPRLEKITQLLNVMAIVAGVRLFNRDCKKGGEGIPDLPFDLVVAAKACLASLSNSLITVMERVNSLTTAIEEHVAIQDETGNIYVDIPSHTDLTEDDYKHIFDLLSFNRQYEMFIRNLLSDVGYMTHNANKYVEQIKSVLEHLHKAVKYKEAVPTVTVFPLFSDLWKVWRDMQNVMYLVSTVNRLMSSLATIQDQIKIPYNIVDKMLQGKNVKTDLERTLNHDVIIADNISLLSLKNYSVCGQESVLSSRERCANYLGFCAMCLCVGALIPSSTKVGMIKVKGQRYGFCSVKMAARFAKDPQRYINEVLDLARNNPHMINLLNIIDEVYKVKDVDKLVVKYAPKIKVFDKDIQTEVHPIEENIDRNYSWDLWEWKKRACQWANIVNCKTHSTQTNYSHLRSEIQCQTVQPRDKCMQTKRDCGVNTISNNFFVWGLRGQLGYGQHSMDLREQHSPERRKAKSVSTCVWPCIGPEYTQSASKSSETISVKVHFTTN